MWPIDDPKKCADLTFLALTVWREARGESLDGKVSVAHCIMNRVQRPAWWGKDILSVVFKKWQFSSLTDPRDAQLTTWPKTDDKSWAECLSVAAGVLSRLYKNPVPGADSYFDISIPAPPWAKADLFVKQIGRLKFYNIDKDIENEADA